MGRERLGVLAVPTFDGHPIFELLTTFDNRLDKLATVNP